MRKALLAIALAGMPICPLAAQDDQAETQSNETRRLPPGVERAVDLIKEQHFAKTLFYMELLDHPQYDQPVLRADVVGQIPTIDTLLTLSREETGALMQALQADLQAFDERGWRRIAIIVEGEDVRVAPGPNPGTFDGFPGRFRALVEREFPGVL